MGTKRGRGTGRWAALAAAGALLGGSAWAQAGKGAVQCAVRENGEPASGSLVVRRGGEEIARGACGRPVEVPAGAYTAIVALDGALDGPEQTKEISVDPGQTREITAAFETGELEVRIEREGRRAAGMAIIRRDGAQIGTLGSGVRAHLSAGRYEVLVRYRNDEKSFPDVEIKPGQPTKLEAAF